jgi:hypothetical protein
LYEAVEGKARDDKEKATILQQFLVCAEARYVRYLGLLDGFSKGFNSGKEGKIFAQTMPLPPWYTYT